MKKGFYPQDTRQGGFCPASLVVSAKRRAFAGSSPDLARLRTENESQLFFFSILRFRTMSLRLSKLETVRVGDLAPSFSACNS